MRRAFQIIIIGIVQGVGFRPFIYRVAAQSGVKGYVRNRSGSEVEVRVEGSSEEIGNFFKLFLEQLPQPAKIEEIEFIEEELENYNSFHILPSINHLSKRSIITPDIGICEYCIEEVLNSKTRWYNYPFNSCVWCGPRFSMMYRAPYDRENTSMNSFPLCRECMEEYSNPQNIRRFHAQGISCSKCGPKVWLTDSKGRTINSENPIEKAAQLIDCGSIVAVKGLGGFHIAALASNDEVIAKLRERKKRPSKPFALMALNLDIIKKFAYISSEAEKLLTSPEKPIVLLPVKNGVEISSLIAPGLDFIGVMLPYTSLHYMLLKDTRDKYLVMTSGNEYGKPMCTSESEAFEKLSKFVDYFLLHNREIVNRVDDSVVRLTDNKQILLRRGRGYAPAWIRIPVNLSRPIIAFGAELQTAGAVAFEDKAVLTQYIGDADDYDIIIDLDRYIKFFTDIYNINPSESIVVVDKHPMYASRRLGEEWSNKYGAKMVEVQHHHAHAASIMADYKVNSNTKAVSIVMDGMGYGDDGHIWGGEVIEVSYSEYRRIGHLKYQPQPGGDSATEYPVKMLIGILSSILNERELLNLLNERKLESGLKWGLQEAQVAYRQSIIGRTPLTSSTGRILDAAAALLGICFKRTYEGEPAMRLEALSHSGKLIEYIEAPVKNSNGVGIIDTTKLFETVLNNIDHESRNLAYSIHYRLGESLAEIACMAKTTHETGVIYVSGGAAVNDIIIKAIRETLTARGIEVKLPRRVPPNDGGIALGQVVIASSYTIY